MFIRLDILQIEVDNYRPVFCNPKDVFIKIYSYIVLPIIFLYMLEILTFLLFNCYVNVNVIRM